jgi:hypothetical protein
VANVALGRFIQADTLVPDPADPQSLNRFAYVRNNPLNRIDPTGHMDDVGDYLSGGGGAASTARASSSGGSAVSVPSVSATAWPPSPDDPVEYVRWQQGDWYLSPWYSEWREHAAPCWGCHITHFNGRPPTNWELGGDYFDQRKWLVYEIAERSLALGAAYGTQRAYWSASPQGAPGAAGAQPDTVETIPDLTPNKLHHIFGKAGQNLDPLVTAYGGQEAAFRAVYGEFLQVAGDFTQMQLEEGIQITVGDFDVTISGRVVDGVPRIGTFYIP